MNFTLYGSDNVYGYKSSLLAKCAVTYLLAGVGYYPLTLANVSLEDKVQQFGFISFRFLTNRGKF